MPFRRGSWSDAYTDARLTQLTGTTYFSPPAGLWVALMSGVPLSDGSGATNEVVRVAVTYGAPQTLPGQPGYPSQRFIAPSAPVSITAPGPVSPVTFSSGSGWALFTQSSGGSPVYAATYGWRVQNGVANSFPPDVFRVFAEDQN